MEKIKVLVQEIARQLRRRFPDIPVYEQWIWDRYGEDALLEAAAAIRHLPASQQIAIVTERFGRDAHYVIPVLNQIINGR